MICHDKNAADRAKCIIRTGQVIYRGGKYGIQIQVQSASE